MGYQGQCATGFQVSLTHSLTHFLSPTKSCTLPVACPDAAVLPAFVEFRRSISIPVKKNYLLATMHPDLFNVQLTTGSMLSSDRPAIMKCPLHLPVCAFLCPSSESTTEVMPRTAPNPPHHHASVSKFLTLPLWLCSSSTRKACLQTLPWIHSFFE